MTVATTASTATGVYPITVTATDGTVTNTAYPELTINPPCVAPTATTQKLTVPENSGVAITLAGTLGSGCASTDTLNASVTVNPSHGVLTGTTPNLFYTPTSGFAGSDSFSFTVTDANAIDRNGLDGERKRLHFGFDGVVEWSVKDHHICQFDPVDGSHCGLGHKRLRSG
jgi:hypothetical protein